jgi:hypothetical protein
MKPTHCYISLVIGLCLSAAAQADTIYQAIGEARDVKTGEMLYTEQHRREGIEHSVDYFLPNGKLIVTNRQNFQYSPYVPTVEQTDLRDNERSGLLRKDNRWILYNNDERETVDNQDPLVASAGFDSFIRQHWAQLSRGESLDFDFAIPQSLFLAPLRLEKIDCKVADVSRIEPNSLCLEVTPSSMLFSFFFDPIEVVYDQATKNLMAYRGLTNLNDAEGDAYEAEIFYRYKNFDRPQASEKSQLKATALLDVDK